ncbi:membrane dipeptidase [Streptomyces sp. NPDC054834]
MRIHVHRRRPDQVATWPCAAGFEVEALMLLAPDRHHRARDRPLRAGPTRPEVTVVRVADHVEHAREVAGMDHIGPGGDYDGVDHQPTGLADVSGYPVLLREPADRGWPRPKPEALTGRNVLRVLRGAEERATEPLWPAVPLR